jgi:hypothetical protein
MNRPPSEQPFGLNRVNGPADFDPGWDVPSVGRAATAALSKDIAAVRARPEPDPARRIHLFRGAPGYGKTHLFGRAGHEQGERVRFVSVPSPPGGAEPPGRAAWVVAETLFHSPGTVAPVRAHLARLLAPSLAAYFDQLPDGLRARCAEFRAALREDPLAALKVFGPVTDLAPYHALADAVRKRLTDVPGAAVRALSGREKGKPPPVPPGGHQRRSPPGGTARNGLRMPLTTCLYRTAADAAPPPPRCGVPRLHPPGARYFFLSRPGVEMYRPAQS